MLDINNQYGTKDRQLELLDMMKDLDAILREGGVKYSLCGGTLLGAVRDKGFIPWDDDIDIMVDRFNFNKLVRLFKSSDTPYRLVDFLWVRRIQKKGDTRKDLFAATIDVFVVDHCPDSRFKQGLKVLLIRILQGMMKVDRNESQVSWIYKAALLVTGLFGKLFSEEKKLRWYDQVSKIGNRYRTDYVGIYNDLFKYVPLKYNRKMMDNVIDTPYEDTSLPITAEYDHYLTTVYGDYMTPPEEKDRKPLHI